ncbi:MAG: nucleotidyltransferase domain-containing protein [Bacteroidia bacterium]
MKRKHTYNDKNVTSIVATLVKIADPDKIILFGSHATGGAKNDSDYDFCVLKKNVNCKMLLSKIYAHGLNADVPVDIIVNTPVRFDSLKKKNFLVYYDISKYGLIVYEKKR